MDDALSKIEKDNKHTQEIIDTTSTLAEINSSPSIISNKWIMDYGSFEIVQG